MRLALVSKKSKVLYFLPFCFYQDKMVFNNKNSQHNFDLSIKANNATIAGYIPYTKEIIIKSLRSNAVLHMGFFKVQKCSFRYVFMEFLLILLLFTHFQVCHFLRQTN